MAFVERLPALVEPMAGLPDTWRARLEDGTPVAVRRYPEPDPERTGAALPRLRAAASVRSPRMLAPLGAAVDAEGLSVLYPADLGAGLERALQKPLGPAAALALADDMFSGLDALHAADLAHGAVGEPAVRLYPDGHARLWGLPPWGAAGPAARAEDVRAAAQMLARAIGVPLEWTPSDPLRDAERAAPALAATLRALGRGSLALDARGALAAVREAAGSLGSEDSVDAGRAELAALAGVRRGAAAPPAAPRAAAQTGPLAPLEPGGRRRLPIAIGVIVGLALLGTAGLIGFHTASRPAAPTAQRSPESSPSPTSEPSPHPSPSLAPSSAGDIESVTQTALSTCAQGASCTLEVEVHFTKATAPEEVAWQFELVDGCTGDATYVDGNTIQAQAGWTHVIGDRRVSLPSGHPLSVIAVTTTPSQAASSPLLVPGGTC